MLPNVDCLKTMTRFYTMSKSNTIIVDSDIVLCYINLIHIFHMLRIE